MAVLQTGCEAASLEVVRGCQAFSLPMASAGRQDLDLQRLHQELYLHRRGHPVQEFPVSLRDLLQGQ